MDKPPSTRSGTTPLTWPSVFALLINIASMSATMLNKTGDKGSPCLKPFLLQTLRMKGFSTRWISWVKSFIYGGSVAINVNNEIGPYFQTKLLVPLWGQGQGQLTKLLVPPCPHKATRVAVDLMVAKVPLVGSPSSLVDALTNTRPSIESLTATRGASSLHTQVFSLYISFFMPLLLVR